MHVAQGIYYCNGCDTNFDAKAQVLTKEYANKR
jgi:hypothetical protein